MFRKLIRFSPTDEQVLESCNVGFHRGMERLPLAVSVFSFSVVVCTEEVLADGTTPSPLQAFDTLVNLVVDDEKNFAFFKHKLLCLVRFPI